MDYRIFPPEGIVETTVECPDSKSMRARALMIQAIAGRPDTADTCTDISTLASVLASYPALPEHIDVGASGTAMRFLCALCAATEGCRTLTGCKRMLHRPIGPLVDALRSLGADMSYDGVEDFPPVTISGNTLRGGNVTVDASASSQYVSALMLTAPLMASPLHIELTGAVGSMPYIALTAGMMRQCGVNATIERNTIDVPNAPYALNGLTGEPDWSAAAFWYEIAALSAGWITLTNLNPQSLQGDRGIVPLFEKLGVITDHTDDGIELSATPELYNSLDADLSGMPDAVPALAVTACMVGVPFRFSGVGALHHKECDRIEALVAELAKLGFVLEVEAYGTVLSWDGTRRPVRQMPVFDTYGDHRMAMALAPTAIFVPGIVVKDVEVVEKSYPDYWQHLRHAGFTLLDPSEPIPDTEE